MATIIESGHAKNLANFETLITFIAENGIEYKPTNPILTLQSLKAIANSSRKSLTDVNELLPAYSNSIAARDVEFKNLNKLVTRIMNSLRAVGTSHQVDDNVRTLARKIQGIRASDKKTDDEKDALIAEGKKVGKEVSSSQTSFDNRLENFNKLIILLSSIPLYAPNEKDLQIESLKSLHEKLIEVNTTARLALAPLSNARIERNEIMYKPETGLVDVALTVKIYIKSLFGAGSPKYKQISGITFNQLKQ